jgi:hypothetical protein
MSRPEGLPKTGGRERGTPNKRTLDLAQKLEALGCDPIEGLARIAMDTATAPDLQVRCYAELAQYVHAKRKAIALESAPSDDMRVIVEFREPSPTD